jgi:serine/threonine protein kinase
MGRFARISFFLFFFSYSFPSDMYSLGIVLYILMTGKYAECFYFFVVCGVIMLCCTYILCLFYFIFI